MDLGMALAAGLGNAMTKGADGMAQERKEQGLLERMLAQQGAIGDRQQALMDARLAASGGGSSSGSRSRSGSGGLLDVVDAGILTPEQNRASIIGQAGTMADLERNTQIINNPNAARAGMERQVPPGEAGPPMMMDDKAWQGQVDSAVNFMRDIRTAMARSSADYNDMSGGDALNQKTNFVEAGLQSTKPGQSDAWAAKGAPLFNAIEGKQSNQEAIDRRTEQREADSERRDRQATVRNLNSMLASKRTELVSLRKNDSLGKDKETSDALAAEVRALEEEIRSLSSPGVSPQSGTGGGMSPAERARQFALMKQGK